MYMLDYYQLILVMHCITTFCYWLIHTHTGIRLWTVQISESVSGEGWVFISTMKFHYSWLSFSMVLWLAFWFFFWWWPEFLPLTIPPHPHPHPAPPPNPQYPIVLNNWLFDDVTMLKEWNYDTKPWIFSIAGNAQVNLRTLNRNISE